MAEITGLTELLRGLDELQRAAENLDSARRESANLILRAARPRINSVSGRLVRSGRVRVGTGEATAEFGGGSIRWAGPNHEGDSDRPQGGFVVPNPFLEDAADVMDERIGQVHDEHLGREIDRIF